MAFFRFLMLILMIGMNYFQLSAAPLAAGFSDTLPHSILWKIEGKELQKPSYLLGTIHMISRQDFFFTPVMESALAACDKVVFEIDMKELTDEGQMMSLFSASFMRGDTSLGDLLTKVEYERVADHFETLGLPLAMFDRMKPMFLSILAASPELTSLNEEEVTSYEVEISQRAEESGKETGGLETVAFQLSIFDSIPYTVQAKMLLESIDAGDMSASSEGLDELVEKYKLQDLNALQAMISDSTSGMGVYEDMFLKNRNQNWIPGIQRMIREKPTFFAVGAGHLPGRDGVIHLLRQAGYKLSPVNIF